MALIISRRSSYCPNFATAPFMSILLMNALPKTRRPALMPAFVFSIHCFVFLSYIAGFFVSANNVVALMIIGALITIALGIFSFTRRPITSIQSPEREKM